MARSPHHFATVKASSPKDYAKLEETRALIARLNVALKGDGVRLRVDLKRKRKVAPEFAWKYDNRFLRGTKPRAEDRDADVYIRPRKS